MKTKENICQICGNNGPDMRHVLVESFYQISEFTDKVKPMTIFCPVEETTLIGDVLASRIAYQVICCKSCRKDFHQAFKTWVNGGLKNS